MTYDQWKTTAPEYDEHPAYMKAEGEVVEEDGEYFDIRDDGKHQWTGYEFEKVS